MQDQCLSSRGPSNKLIFPMMALLAGILGGVFGIGGGMLISPLLLHIGIAPEVSSMNILTSDVLPSILKMLVTFLLFSQSYLKN